LTTLLNIAMTIHECHLPSWGVVCCGPRCRTSVEGLRYRVHADLYAESSK